MASAPPFQDETARHFPTLFMRRRFADAAALNRELAALLLDMEERAFNKRAGTSNVGGYHTDTKLLHRNAASIHTLRQMIGAAIGAYLPQLVQAECSAPPENLRLTIWGWGLVMREGDFNQMHIHPDAHVSGVYYVAVPEAMAQSRPDQPYGQISFVDPRVRASAMRLPNQVSAHAVNPQAGDMILFPSFYEHGVTPFKGPGTRICVAFNAKAG